MNPETPNPTVVGIGSFVPNRVLSNRDLEEMVDTSDEWIRKRTGIQRRRLATDDQAASDLGLEASRAALADAGLEPDELDLIVCATSTPDMFFPSTACILQDKLGIGSIGAYDVNAGCTGFVYALAAAQGHMLAGLADTVLVVGAEITSSFSDYTDRSTCILFGDGAGAVILQNQPDQQVPGISGVELGADGSYRDILKRPSPGSAQPVDRDVLERGDQYIEMDGRTLFKIAVRKMGEVAVTSLEKAGLEPADVDWVIPHQANLRIINAVRERLELPKDKMIVNVQEYGNTSSASVAIALDEAYREGRIQSGDLVLMVAFGAGLTWGGCVIRCP